MNLNLIDLVHVRAVRDLGVNKLVILSASTWPLVIKIAYLVKYNCIK